MQSRLLHSTVLGLNQADSPRSDLQVVSSLQMEERAAAAGVWRAGLLLSAPANCVAQLYLTLAYLAGMLGRLLYVLSLLTNQSPL